jgi:hypothetical protein
MSPILVAVNGQGSILTAEELRRLFTNGLLTSRDRAMLDICLFTCTGFMKWVILFAKADKNNQILIDNIGKHKLPLSTTPLTEGAIRGCRWYYALALQTNDSEGRKLTF